MRPLIARQDKYSDARVISKSTTVLYCGSKYRDTRRYMYLDFRFVMRPHYLRTTVIQSREMFHRY